MSLSDKMVDSMFPEKEIQVGPGDLPYFTEELRHQLRAYNAHGAKSVQYKSLKLKFEQILECESRKYIHKIETEISEGRRGYGYKVIRKLGNQPGESWHNPEVNIQSYINWLTSSLPYVILLTRLMKASSLLTCARR